ncbi:hypothetical protein, partial [Helicobacter typhlonius]|uniref:hypothetical protein n=1 Tax=Helicobacter typhlonius TaxID=76936 RepID=UPI002FE2EBEA
MNRVGHPLGGLSLKCLHCLSLLIKILESKQILESKNRKSYFKFLNHTLVYHCSSNLAESCN